MYKLQLDKTSAEKRSAEMNRERINIAILEIHDRDGWRCQHKDCNKRSEEVAHRISQSKSNKSVIKERLKWLDLENIIKVDDVIHHPLNLVASCSTHNSYFNIGNRPIESTRLINKIIKELINEKV